ncbi:hypothetical protein MA9V1_045 [Chryseobacterium phage MA9V-1]|nr:hypothetical protein MA9V1_045 [Chryseobacterium phage MA9V-1]
MSTDLFNSVFDFDASAMTTFETVAGNTVEMFNPKPEGGKQYLVQVRLLTNVKSPKDSIVHKKFYWLGDAAGNFGFDAATTVGGFCPVSTAYWALFNSDNQAVKDLANGLRQQKSYIVYIQVVNDTYNPANNGKILPWKIPVPVYKKIEGWLKPTEDEVKAGMTAKPLFNPFMSFNLMLKITNKVVGTTTMRDYEASLTDTQLPMSIDGVPLTDTPENRTKFVDYLTEHQTVDIVERFGYKEADDVTKGRVKAMLGTTYGQPTNYWPEINAVAGQAPAVETAAPTIVNPIADQVQAAQATVMTPEVVQPAQVSDPADIASMVSSITGGTN